MRFGACFDVMKVEYFGEFWCVLSLKSGHSGSGTHERVTHDMVYYDDGRGADSK